jgi:hypothetical protein
LPNHSNRHRPLRRRWRRAIGVIVTHWVAVILVTIVLAYIAFAVKIASNGWREIYKESAITCQVAFQPLRATKNGYIELFLDSQQSLEPIFDGGYFINLTDAYGETPKKIRVEISGDQHYGDTDYFADLRWDAQNQLLWMADRAKMTFVPISGSHRRFPFDSAQFSFKLRVEPAVNLPVFRVTSRVAGFEMPCSLLTVNRDTDASYSVSFFLRRSEFLQDTVCILFGAAALFSLAIAFYVESKSLPTAVASFFFSLWSIRLIFGLDTQGFPTLFDLGILALCLLFILLLLVRFSLPRLSKASKLPGALP